ncbi:hypothetical protein KAI04_01225 [Candidatus Pacearchaeota archaeon]|nr:hypothetical protein [Candidatus Pacearchaeota archaeon]
MAKIQKFNVIKIASLRGLFGFFVGILIGIILTIFLSSIPFLATYPIWMILVGVPIAFGIFMFIITLIFTLIINLSLKIIKGLDLDVDLTESTSVNKVDTTKLNKGKPIKPVEPIKSVKQVIKHPITSAKDSSPISQMTNSKTAIPNPLIKKSIK